MAMIARLNRWRSGTLGTIIFYGYLFAILATAVIAITAVNGVKQSNAKIAGTVVTLNAVTDRSCKAIHGALVYWTSERQRAVESLTDSPLSEVRAQVIQSKITSLDKVLKSGERLDCR